MHSIDYVHGDLKMKNLTWCGNTETIKLIDFTHSYKIDDKVVNTVYLRSYKRMSFCLPGRLQTTNNCL